MLPVALKLRQEESHREGLTCVPLNRCVRNTGNLQNSAPGTYAFEAQMPGWLKHRCQNTSTTWKDVQYGPEPKITIPLLTNETYGIVPVLQQLSGTDSRVKR